MCIMDWKHSLLTTICIHEQTEVEKTCREKIGRNHLCEKTYSLCFKSIQSADVVFVLAPCVLTRFLWRSGESSFNGAAVGVVPTTNATFVLNFVGANLSVAANFLETKKIIDR